MRISAKIIVFNEEKHIAAVCESLAWADEIVIVDSSSTDRTVEIARQYTDKIYQHEFRGYGDKHEFADSMTTGDWIFWIDADERVTDALRHSILAIREQPESQLPDGFKMARKTFYLGRFIRYCGWYPDYKMRLYRKSASSWMGISPHETARVKGRVDTLAGDLLHFTKDSISDQHNVLDLNTSLAAEYYAKRGKRIGALGLLFRPMGALFRTLVLNQGYREGIVGLIISIQTAYGVFLKYAKVWEKGAIHR